MTDRLPEIRAMAAMRGTSMRISSDDLSVIVARIDAQAAEIERLSADLDTALELLAGWCVDVDRNGTGWDDWDENYKNAMYRPGPLREKLDAAIRGEINDRESK